MFASIYAKTRVLPRDVERITGAHSPQMKATATHQLSLYAMDCRAPHRQSSQHVSSVFRFHATEDRFKNP